MAKNLSTKKLLSLIKTNPEFVDFSMREEEIEIQKELLKLKKNNTELDDFLIHQKEIEINKELIKGEDGENGEDGEDGIDGHTPTKEELLDLIIPLIPEVIQGKDGNTPSSSELRELIKPLIPEAIQGKDGLSPTRDELKALMMPIINRLMPIIPSIDEKKLIKGILSKIELPKSTENITDLIDVPNKIQPGMALIGSLDGKNLIFKKIGKRTGEQYLHGGGKLIIKDEGTILNENVTTLDFVGTQITASADGRKVTITVNSKIQRNTTTTTIDSTSYQWNGNTDITGFTYTLPVGVQDRAYKIVNTGTSSRLLTITPDGTEKLLGINSSFTLNDSESLIISFDTIDGWY